MRCCSKPVYNSIDAHCLSYPRSVNDANYLQTNEFVPDAKTVIKVGEKKRARIRSFEAEKDQIGLSLLEPTPAQSRAPRTQGNGATSREGEGSRGGRLPRGGGRGGRGGRGGAGINAQGAHHIAE